MMGTAKTNRDPPPPLFDSTVPFKGLASSMTKMSGAIPAGRQVSPSRAVHHRARATKVGAGGDRIMVVGARRGTVRGSPLAGRKRRTGWARVNIHRLGSVRLVFRRSGGRPPRPPCNDAPFLLQLLLLLLLLRCFVSPHLLDHSCASSIYLHPLSASSSRCSLPLQRLYMITNAQIWLLDPNQL